jgi:hypothetical protein
MVLLAIPVVLGCIAASLGLLQEAQRKAQEQPASRAAVLAFIKSRSGGAI